MPRLFHYRERAVTPIVLAGTDSRLSPPAPRAVKGSSELLSISIRPATFGGSLSIMRCFLATGLPDGTNLGWDGEEGRQRCTPDT